MEEDCIQNYFMSVKDKSVVILKSFINTFFIMLIGMLSKAHLRLKRFLHNVFFSTCTSNKQKKIENVYEMFIKELQ